MSQSRAEPGAAEAAVWAIVAASIDAAFYLGRNADVRDAALDPTEHYCSTGWREGRDPAAWFQTDYYLGANPDIRAAGLNPFWHYLVQGRGEGRAARPPDDAWRGELSASRLPGGRPVARVVPDGAPGRVMPDGAPGLDAAALRACVVAARESTSGLVVALSHDRYTDVPGGTQLLIADEQRKFNGDHVTYLHLSPIEPRLGLAPLSPEPARLNVILDGRFCGVATMDAITAALAGPGDARPCVLVVHNLHGHRPEAVADLVGAIRPLHCIFWVHDYGAACGNPRLLRNGIASCLAPPPDSLGCRVCVHGEDRHAHIDRVRALFQSVAFNVVAPSRAALDVWQRAIALPVASLRVHSHAVLGSDATAPADPVTRSGPVRVAFVGPAAYCKGWHVFVALVAATRDTGDYQFFQFASPAALQPLEGAVPVAGETTPEQPFGMGRALAGHRIDLVLALSPWPETFGYVAHEALAAGADVITTQASGNVAALVREMSRGLVLADADAVLDCFLTRTAAHHAHARRAAPPGKLALRHTGSTATLSLDEATMETTTDEPDLHLLVSGARLDGSRTRDTWRFALPPPGNDGAHRTVRLRSRHLKPAWSAAHAEDSRQLGVAVTALALDGQPILAGAPARNGGWHPPETGWQWTDGDATVVAGMASVLEVSVVRLARYWRAPLVAR